MTTLSETISLKTELEVMGRDATQSISPSSRAIGLKFIAAAIANGFSAR